MYENNNSTFPDNKQIINVLKEDDTVKKYMKKLMPFVAYVKVTFCYFNPLLPSVPFSGYKVLKG